YVRRQLRSVREGGGEVRSRREHEGCQSFARAWNRRQQGQGHAHLGKVRGRKRQAAAFGVHREGRCVLRSDRRSQNRQGGKGGTDHRRRRPHRCQVSKRSHQQGQDFAASRRVQGRKGEQGIQGGERYAIAQG